MNPNLLNTVILAGIFLSLFVTSEIIYYKFKAKAEYTRKYTHLMTGVLTLLFPAMIDNHFYILALNSSFLLILLLSMKFNLLKSINNVERKTQGSLLYPVTVYGVFIFYEYTGNLVFYYIPILILAICDPIAALVGKGYPRGRYTLFGKTKTLTGSLGFLFSAVIVSFLLMFFLSSTPILTILIIAFALGLSTTISEAVSHGGYDNITIPVTAVAVLYIAFKNHAILSL